MSLPISMLLKNLIKNVSSDDKNIFISGLSTNSKYIKKNYIFFAIKGNKLNGENFIKEAINKGASVIIASKKCKFVSKDIPIIKTSNIRHLLSELSSKFYKLKPKNIIAVTGTNGKTSVADLFYQILSINNISVASIGTLGIKFDGKTIKTNLTSPDTLSLHKNLQMLKKKKIDNVIIESSSHGLDQKRLHHIKFKGAVFTNFSQDHLDYHKNMKSYLNAKLILFREILKRKSTVISDKKIGPFFLLKKIANKKNLRILDISKELKKIKIKKLGFKDNFKMKNLAMAIKAAKLAGLRENVIYKSLKKIRDVSGRLELVQKYSNGTRVFIDYAHTPDALSKTLESLRSSYGKNISLVFGCGGDRDKKKRALMAKIADKYCKKIYVTDDNPRNENPKKIRSEILKNIKDKKNKKVFNIGNRRIAITRAVQNAEHQEIILVAGKGHEDQQIYKNKIIKISDKKIINKIKVNILNNKKQNVLQNKLILKDILGVFKNVEFTGFSIDTRLIKKDNLFLAIKGKKNDGNQFINEALKKKAGCIITSSKIKKKNRKIIKVRDTISFLNHFAKLKRKKSFAKIIAITGSAGKTSLKNLITNLLQNSGKTYSSPKSYNNHFGVPVSLSNLSSDNKFGVFEVGMSKGGEIKRLTKLIQPDIGIITNIGEAHIENFKNIHEIAKAKSEIIENIKSGGTVVLNKDDKFFNYLYKKAKKYNLKIITFGLHKKSDVSLKKILKKENRSKIFVNMNNQTINFDIKDLNINNILSSLAVLKELKIDVFSIKNKFKYYESIEGRGKNYSISRYKKKFKLIDESYNANPLSVKNAINKFNFIKKEKFKKYLILGDMLELGSRSRKYHEELSKVINNSDIDKVFIKGNKTIFTYKLLKKEKRGNILQNIEDIDLSLNKTISNNDYLMIKGSNATGLYKFSQKMIKGI